MTAHTERTDRPQLTLRSILLGTLLGALAGASNLWVGLKIGWSLGVLLTAAVLGSALAGALHRARVLRTRLGVLEANSMASTASAAGYSTGANLVSAIAAIVMMTGRHLSLVELAAWTLSVAMLGVFIAVPLRRRLIELEELPFPTGSAAAQTLRAIHERGQRGPQARALGIGLAAAAIVTLWTTVAPQLGLHGAWVLPELVPSLAMAAAIPAFAPLVAHGLVVPCSPMLWGAGALIGLRVAASVLVGAIVCHAIASPMLVERGAIASPAYADVVQWSIWLGVPLMVVATLVALARAAAAIRARSTTHGEGPSTGDAIPRRVVWVGVVAAGLACVVLGATSFAIPPWLGALAVALAIVLATVAARVTAETDATPTGPLGKLAQLGFGALVPGATIPALGATSICAGAGASAADLLTDFKCGRLLGADPRRQLVAQIVGVLVGVAVVVPLFRLVLVADPSLLGTESFPAPAAQSWRVVAELLAAGPSTLSASARWAITVGTLLGLLLAIVEARTPARLRAFVPSPIGLGLAFVVPASQAIGFFVGAVAFTLLRRRFDATTLVAVCGGLIAGESLTGVLAALLAA